MTKEPVRLKNPPLTIHKLSTKLNHLALMAKVVDGNIPVRVSNIGGKDHYVTGFSVAPDKSYVRLTTSIGEIESDASTDETESPSE